MVRGSNNGKFAVYNWDGEKWVNTIPVRLTSYTSSQNNIYTYKDYFLIVSGPYNDDVALWNWDGKGWKNTFPTPAASSWAGQTQYVLGDNYFALRRQRNSLSIYNWDGKQWSIDPVYNNKAMPYWDSLQIQGTKDYIAVQTGTPSRYLRILGRTDHGWQQTFPKQGDPAYTDGKDLSANYTPIAVYPGDDFIAICTGTNSHLLTILDWDGQQWRINPDDSLRDITGDYWDHMRLVPGKDFITLVRGSVDYIYNLDTMISWNQIEFLNWNGTKWDWYKWMRNDGTYVSFGGVGYQYQDAGISQGGFNVFAHVTADLNEYSEWAPYIQFGTGPWLDRYYLFSWNGQTWKLPYLETPLALVDIDVGLLSFFTANSGCAAFTYPVNVGQGSKRKILKQFANSFGGDIYTFAVTKKTVSSSTAAYPMS